MLILIAVLLKNTNFLLNNDKQGFINVLLLFLDERNNRVLVSPQPNTILWLAQTATALQPLSREVQIFYF